LFGHLVGHIQSLLLKRIDLVRIDCDLVPFLKS
jgi:hypothetical protein